MTVTPRPADPLTEELPLTPSSERLIRDWDKYPEAIDANELAARLWHIERMARRAGRDREATLDATRAPRSDDALRAALDDIEPPAPGAWSEDYRRGWASALNEVRALATSAPPSSKSYCAHGTLEDHRAYEAELVAFAAAPPSPDPRERAWCICGRGVLPENWENHLLSQKGEHRMRTPAALPSPDVEGPYDSDRMLHAWAILTAETNPERWEPDRYNAAAFVTALLAQYAALRESGS